jgi:hypothetical protein
MVEGRQEATRKKCVADFADLGCRYHVFASECVDAGVYQEPLRQHLVPWPEDLSWQKIRLSVDSAPACVAKTSQGLLAEFQFQWIGHHICRTLIRWTCLSHAFFRFKSRLRLNQIWLPYFCPSLQNRTSSYLLPLECSIHGHHSRCMTTPT